MRLNEIEQKAAEYTNEQMEKGMPIGKDYIDGLKDGFVDGAMWMKGNTDGKALLYTVKKTAERTKKEVFLKVADWLGKNLYKYAENIRITRLISDLKQVIEND